MQRIAVDLDGTLLRTDLLWESAVRLVTRTPLGLARVLRWGLQGPVVLKSELAKRVSLDVATLPYNERLLAELDRRRSAGAEVVLATAAARTYADAVADHLGGFGAVIATEEGGPNQRSEEKARAIDVHFGGAQWIYAGDSAKDLSVWRHAAGAIAVEVRRSVRSRMIATGLPVTFVDPPVGSSGIGPWLRQLRLHQWIKNLLIFVPLATSQLFLEGLAPIIEAMLAFLAFSLMASSIYIWNDLIDLDADRQHSRKRGRPLAAGMVSIPGAIGLAAALALISLALAVLVGWLFLVTLLIYCAATVAYSLWLKRKPMIDVTMLASLYMWRIVAGCAAILVVPSMWLLAFATFFFFGLALIKRYAELQAVGAGGQARGYGRDDAGLVRTLGVSSGLTSVLVFILYIDSSAGTAAFTYPEVLWASVPLMIYWIARAWLVATRAEMHDDPIVYAARNPLSLVVVSLVCGIWLVAALL